MAIGERVLSLSAAGGRGARGFRAAHTVGARRGGLAGGGWGPGLPVHCLGGCCLWGAPLGSVGDHGARRTAVSVQAEAVWGEPCREPMNPTLGKGKQQKGLQLWKPRAKGRVCRLHIPVRGGAEELGKGS